ncbi:MAG: hypothetical protein K2X02_06120 [Alphaproteobacteria bacterium]|nr:hypothetical protein [Alphaproteobacteria bacterium]
MIKKFFFLISLFMFSAASVSAENLILLSNHDNAGDHNQVLGIAEAFKKLSPNVTVKDINAKTTSTSAIKDMVTPVDKTIVIGSGEGGILGIQDLTPQKNLVICLTSHMILGGYSDPNLKQKVNFLALPVHANDTLAAEWKGKLINTTGVAHNRSSKDALKAYELGKGTLPVACSSYLAVYLGGDAPTPEKVTKLFTEAEAQKLADYVAKNAGGSCILVLNGPRTGKHDANLQEIATAHRDGKLDHVTAAFKEKLESQIAPEKVKIYNFHFGQDLGYNTFDLVLGALLENEGKILVPGESTSVISEAIDVLPAGKVTIYNNNAMNEIHEKHVKSEADAGRASFLLDYQTFQDLKSGEKQASSKSAAQTIADRLWEAVH